MNLKGNLTSKGLQGSIGKSRMQGILGTNPAAIPITVDNALSLSSTNPVQNRVITAAITNRLWSDEVKTALLQIVEKVAYVDEHGQDYYDALYDALYPPVGLDSIGAVFDSSATIYNTDTLDDLKQYLTVTAYYTSGDSEVVTTYTLSGSMDAGTQTITVSYGGKTTTFTVTVVEWVNSISAVFTQGSAVIYTTETLDTLRQYLTVTATYADSTTEIVMDYTLSGTLTAGTSTITVGYGGKTTTFNASVTAWDVLWNYTDGFPTTKGWTIDQTTGTASLASDGLLMSAENSQSISYMINPAVVCNKLVFEGVVQFKSFYQISSANRNGMLLQLFNGSRTGNVSVNSYGMCRYSNGGWTGTGVKPLLNTDYTIRVIVDSTSAEIYLNGEYVTTSALGTTSAQQIKIFQGNGGSTLHKSWRIKYVQ